MNSPTKPKLYRHIVDFLYRTSDDSTGTLTCIFFTTSPDVVYKCTTNSDAEFCVPNYVVGNVLHGGSLGRSDNELGQTKCFELDVASIISVADTVERFFSEAD